MKMLKKSLIAIAVLAVVAPAFAGSVMVHDPWTYTKVYTPVPVATIDVIMDVGYYINIVDITPIKISQNGSVGNGNPYINYKGCATTDVQTNFAATLSATVASKNTAVGDSSHYSVTLNPTSIPVGTTPVQICVTGVNLDITALTGGAKDQKVAEVTISVLPTAFVI